MICFRRLPAALSLLLLLAACDDGSGPSVAATSLSLDERELTLTEGDSARLSATVLDQSGEPMHDASVVWSASDTSIASVDPSGALIGRGPGESYAIASVARAGGSALRDSVRVRVLAGAASIRLSSNPHDTDVVLGQAASLRFRVLDRSGDPVRGATVTFAVTSGGGSVSPTDQLSDSLGFVETSFTLGPLPGLHGMTATARGVEPSRWSIQVGDVRSLTLSPDPLVIPAPACEGVLSASLVAASGEQILGRRVDFRLAGPSIVDLVYPSGTGTRSGLTQFVTGRSAGETRVIGRYQGLEDTTVVRVLPGQPVSISIPSQGDTLRVVKGGSVGAQARVVNGCERVMEGEPVTYVSVDPHVASVDEQGTVSGHADGHARIVASTGSLADTVVASVRTFVLLPRDTTIRVGDAVRFQLMTAGPGGALVPFAGAAYYGYGNATLGSVTMSLDGLLTAVSVGEASAWAWTRPPLGGWFVGKVSIRVVARAP